MKTNTSLIIQAPGYQTVVAGVVSACAYLSLAVGSQRYGELGLSHLLAVTCICALLSFWIWYVHQQQGLEIDIKLLLGFAVLFRVIGGLTFPVLEDDFYRYLWDARMTWASGSPYGAPPADFFNDESISTRFEFILGGINYPEVATVYGPTCQWLFALAYAIAPGEVWPLQLLLGLADLALIWVLLKLAKANSVLLYAWCPLVIKEFVITAHPDVFGALLVILALLLRHRQQLIWAGLCLALAAGVKVFALLIVPFILQWHWRAWLAFAMTGVLIALPFGVSDAWLPSGLSAMGSNWLFNAPLYVLLGAWLSINTIKLALLTLLAILCAVHLRSVLKQSAAAPLHSFVRGDILYAALFLCAPAFNAWYLVWLLPFAVLRPSLWAWTASVTILLSYASGINLTNSGLQPYAHHQWVLALEFVPPILAALIPLIFTSRQFVTPR